MAGAGTFPAGAAPAGFDPVAPPSLRTVVQPVIAPMFDPATRDYPLDGSGQVISIHPVDQAVALALSIDQGTLASDPAFGHTLRELKRGTPASLVAGAKDAVALALRTLTGRGDVTLLSVTVETPRRGVVEILVRYVNNRLQAPRTLRAVA